MLVHTPSDHARQVNSSDKQVLILYGIDSLAIDGSMSYEKRDKVVAEFHTPGSPRVFIFSSVGSAGLNLSIADVVIFFVSQDLHLLDASF